jgi:hypothetical protein
MIGSLTDEQIEEVLKENILGRIGCHDEDKDYVVPINYVYDGKHIIAHSIDGLKIKMMRKNPNVCFEVDELKSFTNWRSVIAWGQFQELTEERDRYYAMKLFVEKMLHLKISKTAILPDLTGKKMPPQYAGTHKPIIYRIVLSERTGRYERDVL